MEKSLVVGIDIGAQSSKLGVVDAKGNILCQSVITSLQPTLDEYVHDLTAAIEALIAQAGGKHLIKGIGIGAPNANYYKGTIECAANLTWGRDADGNGIYIDFGKIISEKTGLPVAMTNDANAAAIGEMTYGAARGMKNFIMITLGTGVGSGIVVDGKVVYGHDGFAGELGHTISIRNGRQCSCGLKGCLEAYTSAIGVARTAVEWLQRDDTPSLLREVPDGKMSSKEVYDAAKKGDKLALEIFEFTANLLGEAFANFIAFSAPEAIILFGGLARSREFIEKPIIESMNRNVVSIWKDKVKVEFSQLKDSDAAILGASALGWEL